MLPVFMDAIFLLSHNLKLYSVSKVIPIYTLELERKYVSGVSLAGILGKRTTLLMMGELSLKESKLIARRSNWQLCSFCVTETAKKQLYFALGM